MSTIEIILGFGIVLMIILQIIIASRFKSSQQNDNTPLLVNLSKTINDKFDSNNDKQKDHNYEVKTILTSHTADSKLTFAESLTALQTQINSTIQQALIGLQSSSTIELEKIAKQSKNSFDAVYDANAKKLNEIQEEIEKRIAMISPSCGFS